ncbi:MAG: HAD-IIIC family phosphatase [Clostridia bacterium]|nr:HAD-IIIC family phosphatase [Clostridia bacterium]
MLNFLELKKISKCRKSYSNNLIILSDSASQFLSTAISGYFENEHIDIQVVDTDYNQIDLQILDENSILYESKTKYVVIYMSSEMLYYEYAKSINKSTFFEKVMDKILLYWNKLQKNTNIKIIQFDFLPFDDFVYGNLSFKVKESFFSQINLLNKQVYENASNYGNVFIYKFSSLQNDFGRKNIFDYKMYAMAKLTITQEYLPFVAKGVTDIVKASLGKIKKCIICDLDNTLWGGIIGDDGIDGIELGELGIGQVYVKLQIWLKLLKERGILLAVCSKNNLETAQEPFIKHPDMVLKLDDFVMFVANWDDKASNIKYIQKVLNIGMDSMVFIDDNPFERNLVRTSIPDITVPELPEDPSQYLDYLQQLNLFETINYSENDKARTKQYQEEVGRVNLEKQFTNYDDYLLSLNMTAKMCSFDSYSTPRISQLSQRSNQFNLRTIRLTESDVEHISNDSTYVSKYFTLKDKFGDYGLISYFVLKKLGNVFFIENWLMSCRVLKRGMEEYIINKLFDLARVNSIYKIIGEYIPSNKNSMVKDIYKKLGFKETSSCCFELEVDKYINKKTFVKDEE